MTKTDETLESQLREMYGRVAYTHKTHEKMADQHIARYKFIKRIEIVISAASSTSLLFTVFGDGKAGAVVGAVFATILLGLLLYFKEASLGELAQKHTAVAAKLWGVRERLLGVLVDFRRSSDSFAAIEARNAINTELELLYRNAPRTDAKAYAAAQKALKHQEELYFSDSELDHLLPKQLRTTMGNSSVNSSSPIS